jgi:hypothetical protein
MEKAKALKPDTSSNTKPEGITGTNATLVSGLVTKLIINPNPATLAVPLLKLPSQNTEAAANLLKSPSKGIEQAATASPYSPSLAWDMLLLPPSLLYFSSPIPLVCSTQSTPILFITLDHGGAWHHPLRKTSPAGIATTELAWHQPPRYKIESKKITIDIFWQHSCNCRHHGSHLQFSTSFSLACMFPGPSWYSR